MPNLVPPDLAEIVASSMGRSPYPLLAAAGLSDRLRAVAAKQGLAQNLPGRLKADRPIPILSYSRFRDYARNGNRSRYETVLYGRTAQIKLAAIACALGLDYKEYLQDLIWADCEATWWTLPAHERSSPGIDLLVAMTGREFAFMHAMLGHVLDEEVRGRMVDEVQRRVLRPFAQDAFPFWWRKTTNNWNAVCHGGIVIAAMLLEKDAAVLTTILAKALEGLGRFLEGFTSDGGCTEGMSYWVFGFGWYVAMATALYDFTAGRIDLMRRDGIEAICRYPLSATLRPGQVVPFADCEDVYVPYAMAAQINRFHAIPELLGMCDLAEGGQASIETLEDLLLYDGAPLTAWQDRSSHHLQQLGIALLRRGGLSVAAKAGNNNEHHNHNDIGSFVVHKGRTLFLTDPGAPIYSANTFSERRYESPYCNSFGHSVPVIGGAWQATGEQYRGHLAVEGLEGPTPRCRIKMAGAYNVPELALLRRELTLADDNRVDLTDRFSFRAAPAAVEEAFITALPAAVAADGSSVTITSPSDGRAVLNCRQKGRFRVEEIAGSLAESRDQTPLWRIAFVPASAEKEMTLEFSLRLG
jgi:hypothetical protein